MAFVSNIDFYSGKWRRAGGVDVPLISFEGSEENLEGRNREVFLQFMRSMLRWVPEERKQARELLGDPWLNGNIE